MIYLLPTFVLSLLYLPLTSALNVTYPTTGSNISISEPFTITWTTNSTTDVDHIVINLVSSAYSSSVVLGQNISVFALNYTVPGNTLDSRYLGMDHLTINSVGSEGNVYVASSQDFQLVNGTSAATTSSSASASAKTSASSSSSSAAAVKTAMAVGDGRLLAGVAIAAAMGVLL